MQAGFMLLICADGAHFLWVGPDFEYEEVGFGGASPGPQEVVRWAAQVLRGEVKYIPAVGSRLLAAKVSVEM